MRFITEFKVPESAQSDKGYIPEKRHLSELKMGNMLAESFGWKNPVNHNLDYHRLEIEAFPMDKWVEFKEFFMHHYRIAMSGGDPIVSLMQIGSKLSDLELFDALKETKKII